MDRRNNNNRGWFNFECCNHEENEINIRYKRNTTISDREKEEPLTKEQLRNLSWN